MKRLVTALAGGALLAAVALPAMATQGHQRGGTSSAKCNDGTVTASPAVLWPPNHKLVPVAVSYAENGGDGDNDNISITDIQVNMVDGNGATNVEGNGAGQPSAKQGPDYAVPSPLPGAVPDTNTWTTNVGIRSERAGTTGNGSGRVYSLTVTCHDQGGGPDTSDLNEAGPNGQTGMATVFVCVPHDMSDASRTFCDQQINPGS